MEKHNQPGQQGFTLMELLIIVAILAVLIAIAIPVFSSIREQTLASLCVSNRRSLKALMTVDQINEGATLSSSFQTYLATGDYDCPAGGTLQLRMLENGDFSISCSVHDGALPPDEEASASASATINDMVALAILLSDPANKSDPTYQTFMAKYKYMSNSTLRSYLRDNNAFPTMTVNGTLLYIQPYLNMNALSGRIPSADEVAAQITIFAKTTTADGWSVSYLYDRDSSQWYYSSKSSSDMVNRSWAQLRERTIGAVNSPWQPLAADAFS